MRPPRLPLSGLLSIVAIAAVGLAALSHPSCFWASVAFSLLLLWLTVASLGAVFRRGRERAFWAGCLACGSLYALLSMAPWFDEHVGHRLVTTAMLDALYPIVPLLENTDKTPNDAWKQWTGMPPDYSFAHPRVGFTLGATEAMHGKVTGTAFYVVTTDAFLLIGHSLIAMLAALGGGVLARRFAEPRVTHEPPASTGP